MLVTNVYRIPALQKNSRPKFKVVWNWVTNLLKLLPDQTGLGNQMEYKIGSNLIKLVYIRLYGLLPLACARWSRTISNTDSTNFLLKWELYSFPAQLCCGNTLQLYLTPYALIPFISKQLLVFSRYREKINDLEKYCHLQLPSPVQNS